MRWLNGRKKKGKYNIFVLIAFIATVCGVFIAVVLFTWFVVENRQEICDWWISTASTVSEYNESAFVEVDSWVENGDKHIIKYSKDERVMYYEIVGTGITEMYNADGSLQLYEGDE